MNIGKILKTKGYVIRSINQDAALADAVRLMVEYGIGSLMVVDAENPISIITERDVLGAADGQLQDFTAIRVRDVMARQLVTCDSTFDMNEAMDLMTNNVTGRRIRHLPVVDDGKLTGVVSIGDIVHALLKEARFENRLLKNYIRNWPEEEHEI